VLVADSCDGRAQIRVCALVDGAPVGQESEPLIVRSTFLEPARGRLPMGAELQMDGCDAVAGWR